MGSSDPSADSSASARNQREARFHDERYVEDQRSHLDHIYHRTDFQQRYRSLVRSRAGTGRVLELGCGTGDIASELTRSGATVTAIDISLQAAKHVQRRSTERQRRHPTSRSVKTVVADAERTPFANGSFDLIIGSGIVHHVDTNALWREVDRLLDDEGEAIFVEPLGINPVINAFRALTPRLRTDDEHPLLRRDVDTARGTTGREVAVDFFQVVQIADSAFQLATGRSLPASVQRLLARADGWITRPSNPARWLAWAAVIHLLPHGSSPGSVDH